MRVSVHRSLTEPGEGNSKNKFSCDKKGTSTDHVFQLNISSLLLAVPLLNEAQSHKTSALTPHLRCETFKKSRSGGARARLGLAGILAIDTVSVQISDAEKSFKMIQRWTE